MNAHPWPSLTASKKLSKDFTGKGAEIIEHISSKKKKQDKTPPSNRKGELWYLDGKFHSLSAARPLQLPTKNGISIAKQAASLSLARQKKAETNTFAPKLNREFWEKEGFVFNDEASNNPTPEDLERVEHEDWVSAHLLAQHFAQAMLDGTLLTLARAVVKELSTVSDKSNADKTRDDRADGYSDALFAVAFKSTHPNQVTVQAVKKHMEDHRKRYNGFGLNASELKVREIHKGLKAIGFGWLEAGT